MLKFSPIKTFQIVGIAVFVILGLCAFLFWKNFTLVKTIEKNQISWQWAKNGVLWKYFTVLLINGMAIATPSTLVIFYIKNFLQLEKFTGLFLLTYFLSAILFIPIWKRLCNKIGAAKLFKVGIIGSIVVFSACFFVQSGNVAFYLGICLVSGIFFGIDLIAPTLITNSIIESNKMETARTFIFGITHFISKISIAIISGILLIILGTKTGASYQTILHVSYTILPCILKIVALFVFSFVKNV
jgi:Na+/melibiose symporter-like transporter